MNNKSLVIFVCEHGAAKSIVASAWFNKLSTENGLDFHAIARGTHPDAELSASAVDGLQKDGLTPEETSPVQLALTDLDAAQHTVTFCDLSDDEHHRAVAHDHWDGIPPVSEGYEAARDAMLPRIKNLIAELSTP